MARCLHNRSRFAVLAMVAAVALGQAAGCGIKGPLRLPPPAPGSPPASPPPGATSSPNAAPTQPPEELHAEPPAVPAQPPDPRKP